LNARGQVVGGSSDCANFLHAFLWEEGGPMLDLNILIPPGSGYQLTNAFNNQ
jgi:probable HAF family extracellular repeat protein